MSYARLGAMIATSTVVMFGLMYLNTYTIDHVWFSETRAWMANSVSGGQVAAASTPARGEGGVRVKPGHDKGRLAAYTKLRFRPTR